MQLRNLLSAGVIVGLAHVASAAVNVTDIRSTSDGGGVWLNSNANQTGNWAVWAADGSDPATFTPASFLNDNGSRPFDATNNPNGDRHDPLKVFSLPDGTHTYLLYKGAYGGSDTGSTFYLANGASTGSLVVSSSGAYLSSPSSTPTPGTGSITLGDRQIDVTSHYWYSSAAFQNSDIPGVEKDFIGPQDIMVPDGTGDVIGVVTFNVTALPEPTTLGALGIGAAGLLARRRNH